MYDLLYQAIAERKALSGYYQGYYREFCPHVLGTSGGVEKTLVFQFGGQSSQGLPPGGQWRCLEINGLSDVSVIDHPWVSGTSKHIRPQSCVKMVDIEVPI